MLCPTIQGKGEECEEIGSSYFAIDACGRSSD